MDFFLDPWGTTESFIVGERFAPISLLERLKERVTSPTLMSPEAVIFGSSTLWHPDAVPQYKAWCWAALKCVLSSILRAPCIFFIAELLHWGEEVNQTLSCPGRSRLAVADAWGPGSHRGLPPESGARLRGWAFQAREVPVQRLGPLVEPLCLGTSEQSS